MSAHPKDDGRLHDPGTTMPSSEDEAPLLLAAAARELRVPLGSVHTTLSLLASGALGPLGTRATQLVSAAAEDVVQLLRALEDLTDFGHAHEGLLAVMPVPRDANELAREAVRAVAERAASAGISIDLELPRSLSVLADARRTVAALARALEAAIRVSPPGSRVRLTATRGNDRVQFAVSAAPDRREERGADRAGHTLGTKVARAFVEAQRGSLREHDGTVTMDLPRSSERPPLDLDFLVARAITDTRDELQATLSDTVADLRAQVRRARRTGHVELLEETRSSVRHLRATASTCGLPELSRAAGALETRVERTRGRGTVAEWDAVSRDLDVLEELVRERPEPPAETRRTVPKALARTAVPRGGGPYRKLNHAVDPER